MTLLFPDANIPMYAMGRQHPLKEPCLGVMHLVAEQPGRLRWIGAGAIALPLVIPTWVSFNVLLAFFMLLIVVPVSLVLGVVVWSVGTIAKKLTAARIGQGMVLGALLGLIGGALSCFAVGDLGSGGLLG